MCMHSNDIKLCELTVASVMHLFEPELGRSKPVSSQFSDLLSNCHRQTHKFHIEELLSLKLFSMK